MAASLARWRVVGGEGKGGIIVRAGRALTSSQLDERLPTGTTIEELELQGDRLHFRNAAGPGPKEGWISTKISGKELVVRLSQAESPCHNRSQDATSERKLVTTARNIGDTGSPAPTQREAKTAASQKSARSGDQRSGRPGVLQHPVQLEATFLGTFEVVRAACPVHEEPHMEAAILGLKTRGTRLLGCELTVNGWLKLAGENAWILSTVYGCTPGLGQVLRPIDCSFDSIAEADYHPQGMLRAEVLCEGLPVHAAPSPDSPILGYRRSGELIFAQSQSLDGWLRLDHQEGWISGLSQAKRRSLRVVAASDDEDMDLWALSAAWFAARRRKSAQSDELTATDVQQLQNLAWMTREAARSRYNEYIISGDPQLLLSSGLVAEAQLSQPSAWIKQCIFAELLKRSVQQLLPFRESIGRLPAYARTPPLPLAEEEQTGSMGFWSSACLPFEFEAGPLMMAPNGLLLDPTSCEPIGRFLPEKGEAEPLSMLRHDEETFFLTAESELLDPLTLDVVGHWDAKRGCTRPKSTHEGCGKGESNDSDAEAIIHLVHDTAGGQQDDEAGESRFEELFDEKAEVANAGQTWVGKVTDVDSLD